MEDKSQLVYTILFRTLRLRKDKISRPLQIMKPCCFHNASLFASTSEHLLRTLFEEQFVSETEMIPAGRKTMSPRQCDPFAVA